MNTFPQKISIAILMACILAACAAAPTASPTPLPPTIPPVADPATPTPEPSQTPLPSPTLLPSQTLTPDTVSSDAWATFEAHRAQAQARETRRAPFQTCSSFDENLLSPREIWYICGNAGDFQVMKQDGTSSWQFSAQEQFGTEYNGYFSLLHWTADGNFLYFAVTNPLDGAGPITSNAEALFRMDLSSGKVVTVVGSINNINPATQSFYVVSISPTSRRLAYSVNALYSGDVPPQKKLHLVDLQSGEEKIISIELEYRTIGRFIWSENGQLLTYKLYSYTNDDFCKYAYSVRLLNLTDDVSITFIKKEAIDQCADSMSDEFKVMSVSADQVILEKGDERWKYNVKSQKLELQGTVTPSP